MKKFKKKILKGKFSLKHIVASLGKQCKFVFVDPLAKLLAIPFYSFSVYLLRAKDFYWSTAKCEKMKETGTLVQEISKRPSPQCAQAASSGKALEATGTQRTRSPEHFCRYLIGSLDLGTAKRTTNSEMLHGIKGGKAIKLF